MTATKYGTGELVAYSLALAKALNRLEGSEQRVARRVLRRVLIVLAARGMTVRANGDVVRS